MRVTKQNPPSVAPPVGRYSHVVRVENGDAVWLYVSGQLALDERGELVGTGDLAAQTERVFENLRLILEANGATFDDVVKIESYLTTFDGLEASRDVRARFTPSEPPASTLVRVVALVMPEALIEVDLVAVVPAERSGG
jgi:enamine deaminase RidA (YjgF/YER057c/UK114 family)